MARILSLAVCVLLLAASYFCDSAVFTNKYALKISGGQETAAELAERFGYVNLGQVGFLKDYYLFAHKLTRKRSVRSVEGFHTSIKYHPQVEWFEQQSELKRFKRGNMGEKITIDMLTGSRRNMEIIRNLGRPVKQKYFNYGRIAKLHNLMFGTDIKEDRNRTGEEMEASKEQDNEIYFNDPEWSKLWYLNSKDGINMNVIPAWKRNYTGKGVVITILDDGLDYTHPELIESYDPLASYDINGDDEDPYPRHTLANENRHGTRCAGEIVMKPNNSICGVGIAYGAKIGGIRMLDGKVTDYVEAFSLSYSYQHIDIYSSSWGPNDDGATFDRPRKLTSEALQLGITSGRDSKGVIYIWASGNGGSALDDCNADGYINSIYTVAIGSTDERGTRPWYQESCASTLASTYSSGSIDDRQVITTDLHGQCTTKHTGTSASAPLAAGICALALEANPDLTWRDMQHLIVLTSKRKNLQASDWVTNGAGLQVSHVFGFGLMDADEMVRLAENWVTVPDQHVCEHSMPLGSTGKRKIEPDGVTKFQLLSNGCKRQENMVNYLEHVHALVTLTHPIRGELKLTLISPSGTPSILLNHRPHDSSRYGLYNWAFLTTHTWGEDPYGSWTLEITNPGQHPGALWNLTLIFYGTEYPVIHHQHVRDSLNTDEEACSKDYPHCHELCCGNCDDDTPEGCWKCKYYRDRFTGNCVKDCPEKQFPYALRHQCHWCDESCKTCYGPNPDNCFSCSNPDHYLVEDTSTCVEKCPKEGYYIVGQHCHLCDLQYCLECSAKYTCTKCQPNTVLNSLSTQCEIQCPETTYRDGDECKLCHQGCSECYGPVSDQCLACSDGYLLYGTECKQQDKCDDGHYLIEAIKSCFSCSHFCKICDGSFAEDCTECLEDYTLDGDNICVPGCGEGKFSDLDTGKCEDCPSYCSVCFTKDTCADCQSGYLLRNGNLCDDSCPEGEYEENGGCTHCHSDCKTCQGESANDCITCKGEELIFGGVCITKCFSGFYEVPNRKECLECHISCEECLESAKHCTKCYPEDKLESDKCVPKEGSSRLCQADNCLQCDDDYLDECAECEEGFYLVADWYTCVETCPPGMFNEPSIKECGECHISCTTCSGSGSDDCLTCTEPYFLDGGGHCLQECLDGTYEDFDEGTCIACSDNCKTCYGNGRSQCLSCKGDFYLNYLGECVLPSDCEDYQYANHASWQCESCDIDCLKCEDSSDHCTSCWNGYTLKNSKCELGTGSSCADGEFTDSRGDCQECHWTCLTCTGPEDKDCSKCNNQLFIGGIADPRCVLSCPVGTYGSAESGRCEECSDKCQTCKGPEETDCTSCINGLFILNDSECVVECPAGTFDDLGPMMCYLCHELCQTCINSPFQCTSCENGYLMDGSCEEDCPDGYSRDENLKICKPSSNCPLHCHECDETSWCLECEEGYNEWVGDCIEERRNLCDDNQFMNNSGECEPCHESCKTCWGNKPQDCLTCDDGKTLDSGRCATQCPEGQYEDSESNSCQVCHPTCKTCVGGQVDDCTECKDQLVLAIPSDSSGNEFIGYCESYCPNGYFIESDKDNKCVPCHDSCLTCTDDKETSCISCKAVYVLSTDDEGSKCVDECPPGFFSDTVKDKNGYTSYDCHVCHYHCEECYGKLDTQCYSCKEGSYFMDNACVTSCDQGYYTDGQECTHCHQQCAHCVGPGENDCIQCVGGRVLKTDPFTRKVSCLTDCGDSYYTNSANTCMQCHMSCKRCDGPLPSSCTACREGFTFDPNSKICYPICLSGQYPIKADASQSGMAEKDEDERYEYVDEKNEKEGIKDDYEDVKCGECYQTCQECTGDEMGDCYLCQQHYTFHPTPNFPNGICVPCCEEFPAAEKDKQTFCCNCHTDFGQCDGDLDKYLDEMAGGNNNNPSSSGSQRSFYLAGLVAAVCVIVFILFFLIFGILQARSQKRCCWRQPYQKIPMYYEAENNKVSLDHAYASVPDEYRDDHDEDDIYIQD